MYVRYIPLVNNLTPYCLLLLRCRGSLSPECHGLPHNTKPTPYKEDRIRLDSYPNKASEKKRIQVKKRNYSDGRGSGGGKQSKY